MSNFLVSAYRAGIRRASHNDASTIAQNRSYPRYRLWSELPPSRFLMDDTIYGLYGTWEVLLTDHLEEIDFNGSAESTHRSIVDGVFEGIFNISSNGVDCDEHKGDQG
jgi:hypothetical protein